MGTSIATGIRAVHDGTATGALVVLGDMPYVRPQTLVQLAEAHRPSTRHLVLAPEAGSGAERRQGNPVLWPARTFDALMASRDDVGGKRLLQAAPGAVMRIPVDDDGVLNDVDHLLPTSHA